MSVYIHIPFCKTICSYCDFCKMIYYKKWVDSYLKELKKEILKYYQGELVKTIYIGGGTPTSLDMEELNYLFEIVKIFKLDTDYEFTFECNIDDLNKEKLELLYKNNVNRLSIGIQSFNKNNLKLLNRNHEYSEVKERIDLAREIGFNNINVDLIYAIFGETLNDLKNDLDLFTTLNISHISTYSLMIEPNTKLFINNTEAIDEDIDYEMYKYIVNYLKEKGFNYYEISNFSKEGYESKHNLVYWNNEHYYGFGLGSSGYIDNIRYDNTKSLNQYLKGNYRLNEETINIKKSIENELILGFRKIKGINKLSFYKKYNSKLEELNIIKKLIEEGKLIDDLDNIYIAPKYIYISNEILINFIGE